MLFTIKKEEDKNHVTVLQVTTFFRYVNYCPVLFKFKNLNLNGFGLDFFRLERLQTGSNLANISNIKI